MTKRIARQFGGFALVAIGLAGMVLPGPGVPFLLGGLALLAREYAWAQRALDHTTRLTRRLSTFARDLLARFAPATAG